MLFIVVVITALLVASKFMSIISAVKSRLGMGAGSNYGKHKYGNRRSGEGETIIDARDPEEANRKIFSDDEGEYVDFK